MQASWGLLETYFVKFSKTSVIDNVTFRLHYKLTCYFLLMCSGLSTCYQHFGKPIVCLKHEAPHADYLDNWCWVEGTYSADNVGEEMPHNVGPSTNKDRIHDWYQWVWLVLALQAYLCRLPHYLWKNWEGGKIAALVKEVDYFGLESSDKKRERRLVIVNYVSRTFYFHNLYATKFVFCEILNLLNILGQMYFINYFLNGQFLTYGADVWNYDYSSENATTDLFEPMQRAFPRIANCKLHRSYGVAGGYNDVQTTCVLAINIINSKIFVIIWFWFVTLFILTAVHLITRLLTIASTQFRLFTMFCILDVCNPCGALAYFARRAKANDRADISMLVKRCGYGDWFLLMQLSKHYDPIMFHDFVVDLKDRLNLRQEIKN